MNAARWKAGWEFTSRNLSVPKPAKDSPSDLELDFIQAAVFGLRVI